MGVEYNLISKDAQRALEEFSDEFALALAQGPVEQWAKDLGFYKQSTALKTTYPIPLHAAGYEEFKGDMRYRTLYEKSLELIPKTWQDGIAELASVIEAPDFIGWMNQPAAMAAAGESLVNEIIAGQIEANPTCWDDVTFFNESHPVNYFDPRMGTFSNSFTGSGTNVSVSNLKLAKERFRKLKAANGKPMGLRLTHILAPPALEEEWRDILDSSMTVTIGPDLGSFGAIDNRHKGSVQLIVADELTSDSKWYPMALNKPARFPWIVQDTGIPEEIRHDRDSPMYKTTLKVGLSYILRGNGVLALPHSMQYWEGTA